MQSHHITLKEALDNDEETFLETSLGNCVDQLILGIYFRFQKELIEKFLVERKKCKESSVRRCEKKNWNNS